MLNKTATSNQKKRKKYKQINIVWSGWTVTYPCRSPESLLRCRDHSPPFSQIKAKPNQATPESNQRRGPQYKINGNFDPIIQTRMEKIRSWDNKERDAIEFYGWSESTNTYLERFDSSRERGYGLWVSVTNQVLSSVNVVRPYLKSIILWVPDRNFSFIIFVEGGSCLLIFTF